MELISANVTVDGIIYTINKEEKTAGVSGRTNLQNSHLFIPRSIIFENYEYIITRILEGAFKNSQDIISIEFSDDSEVISFEKESFSKTSIESITIPIHLKKISEYTFYSCRKLRKVEIPINSELSTIEKEAFYCSSIESIMIPENLNELKDGWCDNTFYLQKIGVMPKNKYYSCLYNEYIIKKSFLESDFYDVLVFAIRNIEIATIPKFIKTIGPFAFNGCQKLQTVDFVEDSKLQTIDNYAFYGSSINHIKIPQRVTQIKEGAFLSCNQLRCIKFHPNAEIQAIAKDAFNGSIIESISIPSSLIELKEGWCEETNFLNKIDVNPNNSIFSSYENKFILGKSSSDKENYDVFVFCVRNIIKAEIPSFIEVIASYSFFNCSQLRQIHISIDSKLRKIENSAFYGTMIDRFTVPSNLELIDQYSFIFCERLRYLEFPANSKLQIIGKEAFSHSSINTFYYLQMLLKLMKLPFIDARNFK